MLLSRRSLRLAALFAILMPSIYIGTASATFVYRVHSQNGEAARVKLADAESPAGNQRFLIFSPHCDDETLGCAGLIQQAVAAGARVKVVMITNGDGFRVAVERQFRKLSIGPEDYIRFAGLRQQESYRALGRLGIEPGQILFLGYPDRGLMPMWNDYWSYQRPCTSAYTHTDHSPYRIAYQQGAAYCGQSLLDDSKKILRTFRPTDVYVTHPSDDHPDHAAASAFVTLALRELKAEGVEWADAAKLHFYLVHRGDWPVPQGLQTRDGLIPPGEMTALDTHWSGLRLTRAEQERKERTILAYPSQTSIMRRFLLSFARTNELFGEIEGVRIPRVPQGAVHIDGDPNEWAAIRPAALDPVNDNLLRDFQGGGDVRAVYACRDTTNLYLRVDTYQAISNQVQFTLRLRYFGESTHSGAGGSYRVTVRPGGRVSPPELRTGIAGNRLEIAIPLREIGYARDLALNVETTFAGLQVDRTGYRFLDL